MLRPIEDEHLARLVEVFADPIVAERWVGFDRQRIEEELLDPDDEDLGVYVIEVEEALAGLIQCGEELDPEYRSASLDIALDPVWHGSGVAVDAIRTLARDLIERRGHHHLTIDPAADNTRAIACYAKVGFRPVGVLRRNERGADGTFHDTVLMDLLADELT